MRKAIYAGVAGMAAISTGVYLYNSMSKIPDVKDGDFDINSFHWKDPQEIVELDHQIYNLAQQYLPLAQELLKQLIELPSESISTDPLSGGSNHETARLEFLRQYIITKGAVDSEEDVYYDTFGNLIWTVRDKDDPTPADQLKVVYFDGHIDTCLPLRDDWHMTLGRGIDPFNGLTNPNQVNEKLLKKELEYVPPKDQWDHLIFGTGAVSQLQGIVAQVFATKILLETRELGSLRGAKVVSVATVAGEDNEGCGPHSILRQALKTNDLQNIPDCVVLTEPTGDIQEGPCGIYIGQKGRVQLKLEIIGRTANGACPRSGINPLEYGSLIIAEAAEQARSGLGHNKFLGKSTRVATSSDIRTISNTTIPHKYIIHFDRRLLPNETKELAIKEIQNLTSFKRAREAGNELSITIPQYYAKTHCGYDYFNDMYYRGWITYPRDPVVSAAVESYKRVITPNVEHHPQPSPEFIPKKPRVGSWNISTDGVGYQFRKDSLNQQLESKNWTSDGPYTYPPMFGIGAGLEQHSNCIGEYVNKDQLWAPIAVISRFPSLFVQERNKVQKK